MWQPVRMKRHVFSAVFVLSLLFPLVTFAQETITVRSGGHEDYSRVVFDWNRSVGYLLDKTDSRQLMISFKADAKLDLSDFNPSKLKNISGLRIIANDPLKIALVTPQRGEVKAFNLDNYRFVIDIYDPGKGPEKPVSPAKEKQSQTKPETTKQKPAEKHEQAKATPKPSKKPAAAEEADAVKKPEPVEQAKQEEEPQEQPEQQPEEQEKKEPAETSEDIKQTQDPKQETKQAQKEEQQEKKAEEKPPVQQISPKFELVPENSPATSPPVIDTAENKAESETDPIEKPEVKIKPKAEEKLEKEPEPKPPQIRGSKDKPHLITMTSINRFGLAVFENHGDLWVVTDSDAEHLRPAISSETPYIFGGFADFDLDGGRAFRNILPDGMNMKAQGGELSWRIIMTKDPLVTNPVQPRRVSGSEFPESGYNGKIIWPLENISGQLQMTDPLTGQILQIITVTNAEMYTGPAREFVEFSVLTSSVGIAILPKVDDLTVEITERGVEISRPGGLSILPEKIIDTAVNFEKQYKPKKKATQGRDERRIFEFSIWRKVPFDQLEQTKNSVLASLPQYTSSARVEDLTALAKMHLLSGLGSEALGFLDFAKQEVPDIEKSAPFKALRGMAHAFDWKSELALADFQHPELQAYPEIGYWKSYVLADLGDWQQAINVLPESFDTFYEYPDLIGRRLALTLAEVSLRAGKVDQAEELLAFVEYDEDKITAPMRAELAYLRGEAYRQKGEAQRAVDIWQGLADSDDDLFRVKAGLALTRLLDIQANLPNEQIIDRLERLRYAWRGDQLEAQVNYWLGHAYFKEKEFVKGLGIMRDAAEIAGDSTLGRKIAKDMSETFTALYLGPDLKNISALDAVALYEQFSELTPPGEKGDRLVRLLAEHLVRADLLGRASKLLEKQFKHRLRGQEKVNVGKRLAVIYLLDRQPQKALDILDTVSDTIRTLPREASGKEQQHELKLLTARAMAQDRRPQNALALLNTLESGPNVNRLRADISWQAGYWAEAAEALESVMVDMGLNNARSLTEEQAQLILNQVVALNLANDRIAIANTRKKFLNAMNKTSKSRQFEVITRPRRTTLLADRETLLSVVSEVDLFREFLDAYRDEGSGNADQGQQGSQ